MLIAKKSLAEEVASRLQEQISLGHYKLNEKLPIESELMKSFGVGRSTIREAIKLLANSGMLRVQQGLGTFVERTTGIGEPMEQRLKRANFPDLDEVRQLLEMKIAEKAALNRTDRNITEIKEYLAIRKVTGEQGLVPECVDADIRFHIAIAEASGNEMLADLYKSVAVHLKNWFLQIHHDTHTYTDTHELHAELMQYIIDRKPEEAWATASKIIHYSYQ
jgi:DNA-binding FadR family transcriptional regulator